MSGNTKHKKIVYEARMVHGTPCIYYGDAQMPADDVAEQLNLYEAKSIETAEKISKLYDLVMKKVGRS